MASIQASADRYENHLLTAIGEKLYMESETADVYFVFGDDDNCERVPAHKWLFAAGSDVFKAMFYGELKEKGDVKITDASADAFKEFLQFFYRSKVNLTVENAFDVVNLVKKYHIATCHSICDRFLKNELTITNDSVCSVYGLAILFDMDDLKKRCQSKIVYNIDAVFSSSSFLDCDRSMLSSILKLDVLSCSEVNVFHACMDWVKEKAKQEEVTREMVDAHLGDLFYEIRFGSITLDELADLTPSYGQLFSLDEHLEILQMIRCKDFQPKMFKKDRREFPVLQWNANAVIHCPRMDSVQSNLSRLITIEKTTFKSNQPILLGEIMCLPILFSQLPQYEFEMTIYEISRDGATKARYTHANVILTSKGSKRVVLKKPILIKPGFQYEIQFKPSSAQPMRYIAWSLKDTVQLPDSDVIIEFIGESKTKGLIYFLKFNQISQA